ncbi:pyruvate dehydrogenase E2 (dihydrolipoamide acetyltransferase) [Neobacillus bataviensis LMG 21833]|uniref:Dihydrolipoamide acetyltransferase component of pyruvate dehydrogenase complex n=1 Tax=Neobacillus bataviensis LMG 21833 TaxID=1117379 RepID=K6DEW7_9BACI|nr:dihydrolipoamide acetyltransferase family protein [Neobacillus bataviensis]EKN71072.1 pyruvate dehydrogenase E2 (dihydrolipoamide acetyltransferase) [Neobacillus bataviensis LMG 21833]
MAYEFRLPDIGEGLHEAEVLTWFKNIGDPVKENENLVEVQTDKAVVEISSPVAGTIHSFGAEVGDVVKVGEILFTVLENTNTAAITENKTIIQQESTQETSFRHQAIQQDSRQTQINLLPKQRVIAAPSVRKLARDLGIDITEVTPTGKAGKVTEEDVRSFSAPANKEVAAAIMPVAPKVVSAVQPQQVTIDELAEEIREPIRGLRKRIYENMTLSESKAVHCSGMDEVVVTRLVDLRKQLQPHAEKVGVKLTYLPFFVKAAVKALKRHPIFNASVDDERMEICYKKHIHIGVATATEAGLIVPVIRHADQKTILEIAEEIQDLSIRARERKLRPHELTGSTFTISNTGGNGGWYATPIINYPEVAILGVHSIKRKPIVQDDQIVIGDVMGMSITFDHRIIDGAPSNAFMTDVHSFIENPELLILEGK